MTRWEDQDREVREDIKLAATQQLTRRLDRILSALDTETHPDGVRDLHARRERLERAIEAAARLP
jgi:hypothetical protein